MIVSYDGTDYRGYQLQRGSPGARTVAGELLRMLCTFFQVEAESLSMNVRIEYPHRHCMRARSALYPLAGDATRAGMPAHNCDHALVKGTGGCTQVEPRLF